MVWEEILGFGVRFYSPDGIVSPVVKYIFRQVKKDAKFAKKIMTDIEILPQKIYTNRDIKPIKYKNIKFYELKITSETNISRIFFVIDKSNIVVFHGFTKKSQQIKQADLKQGINNYLDYLKTKKIIKIKLIY